MLVVVAGKLVMMPVMKVVASKAFPSNAAAAATAVSVAVAAAVVVVAAVPVLSAAGTSTM